MGKDGLVARWQRKLDDSAFWLAVHAALAAFTAYFCTYAFRRPFSAAGYADVEFGWSWLSPHLTPKTVFVIAQLIGYGVAKFWGMKFCSEIRRDQLGRATLGMIGLAWLALLGFAVLPLPLKIVAIFLNGIPLGTVWGLIVRQLEGRKVSELLLAALSCSYILASGEVKRVGQWLMAHGVTEFWMPFVTGGLFVPLLFVAVWMLGLLRPPGQEDILERSARGQLDHEGRHAFLKRFLPGLVLLCLVYLFLTAYRDFRDNYQSDLFAEMGIHDPAAFSRTERPVAFGVMAALALIFLVKDNRAALRWVYGLMIGGLVLLGGSTWLYAQGRLGGEMWMIATGLGAYLAYVPFGSVLFDRTIAATRFQGTAVFAIYVADALGYTGSVVVQLYRDFFAPKETWLGFFQGFSTAMAIGGVPLMAIAMVYFLRWKPRGECS
ncbi:DUF5690 family protein [Luteolibacter sp. LG18]|uniref:DUF5690 family protein n=1 Tax=Luteolibacter sp. LG18 TaxID=2819286 RepID=UPI0030C72B3D